MSQWRISLLIVIIFLVGSGVLTRLFSLQILQYDYYSVLAQDQHGLDKILFPQRGEIFIQDLSDSRRNNQENYYPLATNKEFYQVYIIPKDIIDNQKEDLAVRLAELLEIEKEIILQRMNKADDPYEPIKHKVSQVIAQEIANWQINGLAVAPETWRYYPNNQLACHLVGFVGMKDEERIGQYGLEGYYENELKGQVGFLSGQKDTSGYRIPSLKQELKPAQDGPHLILTIDQNIQFKAEKELRQLVERWQAEAGTIIVMEPTSGAIRAMANWPTFDPNQYSQVADIDIFLNPVTQKVYEPGSVFKPITMAAGLDSNQIFPETIYQDKGQLRIKGSTITNVDGKVYGEQTMTQVLEKSINTGAVFVQQKIGQDIFQDYVQRFNFNQPTGIDLIGEVKGNISNLFTGREINLATISFGQGITMTPLGLITALGAIANQGKLMRPFIVEKLIYPDGSEIVKEPQVIKEVISSQTAEKLTKMLVSVVDKGYGRPARVAGYSVAGKTGTAQIPDLERGGYSEDETIHTFVGFAPAFEPRFIILIKLDKPLGIRFAADSVSPVFKKLAEYLFNYLEIPPQ
ncbi:MAG: penicillin-binding protein 2 [Candidatus Portnoybacteria bacterium]|nr:penicillin-binding protein 2 [Candidatus Portnoybacteria bacterium]